MSMHIKMMQNAIEFSINNITYLLPKTLLSPTEGSTA